MKNSIEEHDPFVWRHRATVTYLSLLGCQLASKTPSGCLYFNRSLSSTMDRKEILFVTLVVSGTVLQSGTLKNGPRLYTDEDVYSP